MNVELRNRGIKSKCSLVLNVQIQIANSDYTECLAPYDTLHICITFSTDSIAVFRAQYCFHPSYTISSWGLERKERIIQG